MKPQFATPLARAQIDQLMQPALIRVVDNIRKQLDKTDWQGKYEEDLIWPEGTPDLQKQEYTDLQKRLHGVGPEEHDQVSILISALPQPVPIYTLRLTKAGKTDETVDIWALCYQICALDSRTLDSRTEGDSPEASVMEADLSLFDEAGEVDWRSIDEKT